MYKDLKLGDNDMTLSVMRCPYCGCEGHLEKQDDLWYCAYCGNTCTDDGAEKMLHQIYNGICSQMQGAVDDAVLRAREEQYYNLRSVLWEKVHAKYTDSEAIVSVCRDIKKISPSDFLASFFEVANAGTAEELSHFLNHISVKENALFLDLVIDFMIRSLNSKCILAVAHLIERAYKNSDLKKFEEFTTRLEDEAQRVESGVYSTLIPRDVFIAYSSKDMDSVMELVNLLEGNGLSCFVAMRNLQHGRDAVANYSSALKSAINNSQIIVFISSENSRSFSCDALTAELQYIRDSEIKSAPPELKNDYAKLPYKYKKMRVEYRLDNKPSAVDRFVNDFFAGLDYCETPEKVLARIADLKFYGQRAEEKDVTEAASNPPADVKKADAEKKPPKAPKPPKVKKEKAPKVKKEKAPKQAEQSNDEAITLASVLRNFCGEHKSFFTKRTTKIQKTAYFVGWIFWVSLALLFVGGAAIGDDIVVGCVPIVGVSALARIGFEIATCLQIARSLQASDIFKKWLSKRVLYDLEKILAAALFMIGWIVLFGDPELINFVLIFFMWSLIVTFYTYCPRKCKTIQFTKKSKPIARKAVWVAGIILTFVLIFITASIGM